MRKLDTQAAEGMKEEMKALCRNEAAYGENDGAIFNGPSFNWAERSRRDRGTNGVDVDRVGQDGDSTLRQMGDAGKIGGHGG